MTVKHAPERGALLFETGQFIEELQSARTCLNEFLKPESITVLDQLTRTLETTSTKPVGTTFEWSTARTGPIRTKPNDGAHHGHKGRSLEAEIDFTWMMRTLHRSATRKRDIGSSHLELYGRASTRIWLIDTGGQLMPPQVAMWRFEVGNPSSPGCFFHVQVLGHDLPIDQPHLFPKWLDIPRLPGLIFHPADCIDFVLGELHQELWRERADRTTPDMNRWRPIQRSRLERTLKWQAKSLENAKGSPWATLKRDIPPAELLLDRPIDLYLTSA